jgi:REP element-mobilizing transposase RayT
MARSSSRTPIQLELPRPRIVSTWGGRREGAGRPRLKHRPSVAHRARPFHDASHPVHVTWRVGRRLPNLRQRASAAAIGHAVRATSNDAARARTFRVVHFSIQPDHIHLIVEAGSRQSLARGLQGLGRRIARDVNGVLGRRGRLFADRYHARPLATPREVRNAVVYVLTNFRKHFGPRANTDETCDQLGLDVCSSARWFDGWREPPPRPATPSPVAGPLTWLADAGWRRHGLVCDGERPSALDMMMREPR